MKKLNYILLLLPLLLILLESNSCRNVKYDMTGGRKFDDSVTVSVLTFTNSAPLAKPTLAQTLTESLKDFIQRQTRLTLIPSN